MLNIRRSHFDFPHPLLCHPLFLVLVFLFLISASECSSGDRSFKFQQCLYRCVTSKDGCPQPKDYFLRLFFWTCETNCQYECMWKESTSGTRLQQYYGKWPFVRVFGMQEVVSVVMSVMNGYQHYLGYHQLKRSFLVIPTWVHWFYYASLNVWIWSTVFHARDTWYTERMDYLSATLGNLMQLAGGLCHCWQLPFKWVAMLMGTVFCLHLHRLTPSWLEYRIDFGYNMRFNLLVAFILGMIWLTWGLQQWRAHRSTSSKYLIATLLGMAFALSLEIFDFPPFFYLFDSHALWHTCTVPLVYTWYQFIYHDLLERQGGNISLLPTTIEKKE